MRLMALIIILMLISISSAPSIDANGIPRVEVIHDKQTMVYFKLLHGLYNSMVIALFIYQGFLGLRIRRQRKVSMPAFNLSKRHIRLGPILVIGSMIGFFSGVLVVFIDHGYIFKYPLHFITGLLIILSVVTIFLISKKIKATDYVWRNVHFRLGIFILCLYFIQAFLGLVILL